ncbi:MAG: hypothetical protein WCB27_11730 [Thermoguttaceae bacterium]
MKEPDESSCSFSLDDVSLLEFLLDGEGSERGQILVAAETVHVRLTECLRVRIKKTSADNRFLKLMDDHLSGDVWSPLRDFAGKILISRLFGVIGQELYEVLNAVRELRNAFAHADGTISMDIIASGASSLKKAKQLRASFRHLEKYLNETQRREQGTDENPVIWRIERLRGFDDANKAQPLSNRNVFLAACFTSWDQLSSLCR